MARSRRWIPTLALATVLALTLAIPAAARPAGHHPRAHAAMEELLSDLDLTDDQRSQVEQLFEARHETMAPKLEIVRKAHSALLDRIHAETFDEAAIRAASADVAAAEADLAVARGEAFQKFLQVLTPEQREQARGWLQGHRSKMQHWGRDSGPGPGHPAPSGF